MNVVKVKFVETGTIAVAQQDLPGLGAGNKVPFRREHGALNIDLTMAIDMASAAVGHTFKRYKIQLFVINAKNNREEMVFEEQGTGETNPDEVFDEPKETKVTVKLEGLEGGQNKKEKKAKAE